VLLVADRLVSAGDVDDAQAAHAQGNAPGRIEALVVRPAMLQLTAHRSHERLLDGSRPIFVQNASDAAHARLMLA